MSQPVRSESLARFLQWCIKHRNPKKCAWCEYVHEGRLDYRNHMIEAHPEQNQEFEAWAGINSSVPQGTSKGA